MLTAHRGQVVVEVQQRGHAPRWRRGTAARRRLPECTKVRAVATQSVRLQTYDIDVFGSTGLRYAHTASGQRWAYTYCIQTRTTLCGCVRCTKPRRTQLLAKRGSGRKAPPTPAPGGSRSSRTAAAGAERRAQIAARRPRNRTPPQHQQPPQQQPTDLSMSRAHWGDCPLAGLRAPPPRAARIPCRASDMVCAVGPVGESELVAPESAVPAVETRRVAFGYYY